MKNYFKILVASDYSKAGINAERYAIQLSRATNSVVTFFHVFDEPFYFREHFSEFEKLDENPLMSELTDLKEHISDLYKSMGINPTDDEYHCVVRQGPLAEELYIKAEGDRSDFVIMGTHETDLLKAAIEGSHTWDVIKNAPVPVLAIPEGVAFENIKHIVFATEYRKGEIPVINFLASMARQLDARLTILHIYNDVFSKEFENEMFEKFKNEVKSLIEYDKLSIQLIHNNDLVAGLNGFSIKANANWLVMSHERTMFFVSLFNPISVTKKMSFHTLVPLFTVPDNYKPRHEASGVISTNGHTKGEDMYRDFFIDL